MENCRGNAKRKTQRFLLVLQKQKLSHKTFTTPHIYLVLFRIFMQKLFRCGAEFIMYSTVHTQLHNVCIDRYIIRFQYDTYMVFIVILSLFNCYYCFYSFTHRLLLISSILLHSTIQRVVLLLLCVSISFLLRALCVYFIYSAVWVLLECCRTTTFANSNLYYFC